MEAARARSPVEVITESAINFLSGKPINKDATIGAIESFVQQWTGGIGADYRPDMHGGERESSVHQRAQSGGAWKPWHMGENWGRRTGATPPPQDPDIERQRAIAAARQVFGFAQGEKLTDDAVTKRHRLLVKKHHPDRGGSTEKMAIINNARDVLLAAL
jgi:hypothetical protein